MRWCPKITRLPLNKPVARRILRRHEITIKRTADTSWRNSNRLRLRNWWRGGMKIEQTDHPYTFGSCLPACDTTPTQRKCSRGTGPSKFVRAGVYPHMREKCINSRPFSAYCVPGTPSNRRPRCVMESIRHIAQDDADETVIAKTNLADITGIGLSAGCSKFADADIVRTATCVRSWTSISYLPVDLFRVRCGSRQCSVEVRRVSTITDNAIRITHIVPRCDHSWSSDAQGTGASACATRVGPSIESLQSRMILFGEARAGASVAGSC